MSQAERNQEVYNDLLDTEQSAIGIFTHTEGGTFNPVTEITTGATTTTPACVVVFVGASKGETLPDDFQLERGDRVLILAANGSKPLHGDFITLTAKVDSADSSGTDQLGNWEIFGATEKSAGDNSLFRCYVRKG